MPAYGNIAFRLVPGNVTKARKLSQTCHRCGHAAAESRRSQSEFQCVACGCAGNADVNAALNILAPGDWGCWTARGVGVSHPDEPSTSYAEGWRCRAG